MALHSGQVEAKNGLADLCLSQPEQHQSNACCRCTLWAHFTCRL